MPYAVRKDGKGWRSVGNAGDVSPDETFSTDRPPIIQRIATVTRLQARAALYQAGLIDGVIAHVSGADYFTKLAWDYAQEFHRDSPLVESIGALSGITPSQLDDLFTFASTITA